MLRFLITFLTFPDNVEEIVLVHTGLLGINGERKRGRNHLKSIQVNLGKFRDKSVLSRIKDYASS